MNRAPRLLIAVLACLAFVATATRSFGATTNDTRFLVIVGAPGEASYATNFAAQAAAWTALAQRTGAGSLVLGLDAPPAGTNDLDALRITLAAEPHETPAPLVLVMIGHGSHDGREAKFNLRGPDLTATNLQEWLAPFRRPLAIIDTASCSGAFLPLLSRTNRIVAAATRNGNERNATRLGAALAEALSDPKADLDQDGETSLLEVFLAATARVAESYKSEGRLATEHALIDDNGDGLGTPADWFRGIRATKKTKAGGSVDGLRAHQFALIPSPETLRLDPTQRARRDALEIEVARLRDARTGEPTAEDDAHLEEILRELARLSAH